MWQRCVRSIDAVAISATYSALRLLQEWLRDERYWPSTTNGILETVASQQINKIGHCDDFAMHQSGNHVKLTRGALPKNTATNF